MKTYTFRKRKVRGYLDLPPRPKACHQKDFTQAEGSGDALDELAQGKSQVGISLDTKPQKASAAPGLEPAPGPPGQGGYCQLLNRSDRLLKAYLNRTALDLPLFGKYSERSYLRCK